MYQDEEKTGSDKHKRLENTRQPALPPPPCPRGELTTQTRKHCIKLDVNVTPRQQKPT